MNAMRSRDEHSPPKGQTSNRELRLLSEVDRTPEASQRDLSQRVGIALGVTNVLLKSLAQKGYVRITHAGWKRWLYALTPEGFTRKIQLTVGFVRRTLDDYQQVRQTLREELRPFALNEESRVAICGTGSFGELVYLALKEIGIEEIDVFVTDHSAEVVFLGMPVSHVSALEPQQYDRVLVASLKQTDRIYEEVLDQGVALEKLVTFFPHAWSGEEA